jgi:hypothetical protein
MAFAARVFIQHENCSVFMVPSAEKLRCNVCEVIVDMEKAKEHSTSRDHILQKSKLEGELKETTAKKYNQDSSVVVRWATSTQ